ncbi:TatD family hydrolase [Oceanobacter mangrovi]|uniref:TatD family hydrolase n=1 Tax=Oceanobacter mangrovi TaxID=2862510 RepID=UPI001FE65A27|nr:TatD family hydrolase [Oceanobacter mangrovi]
MPGWIDTHCHFDFPLFDQDRDEIWRHCRDLGVRQLIIPAVDRHQGERLADFCRPEGWWFALGLHPCFLARHQQPDLDWLDMALGQTDAIAVGEFGLDFRKGQTAELRQQQLFWFDAQLALAKQHGLPVILHGVGAHDEITTRIKRSGFTGGGVIHAFSGSLQQAHNYLALGVRLGLGGLLLSPRATRLRQTVTALPLDSWLLETDAPDMIPTITSLQRNTPQFIPLTAAALAAMKEVTMAELQEQQWQLIQQVFHR